jgi:HEAT repeat protein
MGKRTTPEPVVDRHSLAGRMRYLEQVSQQVPSLSDAEASQLAATLSTELQAGPPPAVQLALIRTLEQLRRPTALPGLEWALQQDDREIQQAACKAIAAIDDPRVISVLATTLRTTQDVDVRLFATEGLGRFRDPLAVQALAQSLEDRDPAVQYTAMQSLSRVTGEDLGLDVREWKRLAQDPDRLFGGSSSLRR